jgi:2-polyprenyl-6-methoxyphenol hydroxylase-like FAD-dependent oxidoreductase
VSEQQDCAIVIVGGGPCGLVLAIELGRRGIATVVIEEKTSPTRFPAANATQARTMEHYRRLGFANRLRAQGLPADYPTDISYFTRFTGYELARFKLPSARAATDMVKTMTGSWSAAELPHRVSQMFVEDLLRSEAAALPSVSIRYGWRAAGVSQDADGVTIDAEHAGGRARLRAAYALGADGSRSPVRKALGLSYTGEGAAARDFMGGPMSSLYFRSGKLYDVIPHPRAWTYWTVNADRRSCLFAINGSDEFLFHTQLRAGERHEDISDAQAPALFHTALGAPLDIEVISRATWNAGYTLVADKFRHGRVMLGGDAAHLFTPTGGLGYNTAVEDAVNLGWKLAAMLNGWGGPALLASYETERQALARRNTGYARGFADSVGLFVPSAAIEQDSAAGEAARQAAGNHLNAHARAEFNIPGITFGGRYDGSPIIVPDDTVPPPDAANTYVATACPGGRAPHLWLDDGRSLYDAFGFEFTLLRLGPRAPDAAPFAAAAKARGMPRAIVDVPSQEARDLYQADLALIRPDQIVAWRGNSASDAANVLRKATGH